jgi:multidrug resistance efflux pump
MNTTARILYPVALLAAVAALCAYHIPIEIAVEAPGVARRQAHVVRAIAAAGGRIARIYAGKGSVVRRGDALIQLDARDLLLRRKFLESRIHNAELRRANRSELAHLYDQLEQVRHELNQFIIASPAEGTIASFVPANPNDLLIAGTLVATIIPSSPPVFIEATLPAAERLLITPGQRVRLKSTSFPSDQYNIIGGSVTDIGGVVRIAPDIEIQAGMSFTVHFFTRKERVLYVPFIYLGRRE